VRREPDRMDARKVRSTLVCLVLLPGPASAGLAEPWRFVVTGDSRGYWPDCVNMTIVGEIADQIIRQDADLVVWIGDLVTHYGDLEAELNRWKYAMQPVHDAGIGIYAVRGNHDRVDANAWRSAFSGDWALPQNGPPGEVGLTWSLAHENALIVGMDHYIPGREFLVNQPWLDEQLAANVQPHVFGAAHTPAFKVYHDDSMHLYPADRDVFWQGIAAANGRAYFCGHDHFYDHMRVADGDSRPDNDVHQFIVGTGGGPLYAGGSYDGNNGTWAPELVYHEENYGYVLVEIDDLDVTVTWWRRVAPGSYAPGPDVFQYTAVPAPATILLLALGASLLPRRRRSRQAPCHARRRGM